MGNICVMEGVMQKARTSFLACFLLTVSLWSAKAETTVIEVLNYFNVEDQVKALKDAVASFERANPDIKVQLTYVPFGELLSRTLQTAAVHWPPAISVLDNPDVLRAAEAGILKDLSGRMAEDELRKVAKALTKDPVYGFAFPATNTEECTSAFEPFLWSNRGSLLDIDGSRAKEALRLWMDMLNDGSVSHDVVTWNIGDVSNQFLGGKAAMMLMGPWMLPAMKRSGLDYGVAPVPVPKIGLKPVVAIGGEVWCVMKNDQKIEDAAVKFVSFMEEPERLFKLCLASNYISSVRDLAQKEGEINPDLKPYIEEMETAKPRVSEGGDSYPQISQILRTALQKVLTGQSSIDSALADAAAQIKALDIKQ
jgi:ABC-type glycerol-3-phosphate transport system substrate-binding protein